MTVAKARFYARFSKSCIGLLMRECRFNPDHRVQAVESIKQHHRMLDRLYRQFPEIKPLRSRQLNLFKGA